MYPPIAVLALLFFASFYDVCQAQNPCYADLNQQVATTYAQCGSKPGAAETAPFETVLRDLVCDSTCGPLYNATFYRLCPSPTVSELQLVSYYMAQCRVNANGQACYSFYNDSDADMSVANTQAVQLCSGSVQPSTCSEQCRAQLMAVKSYYGICVNSVFNLTIFPELLPLFSYQLWTNCGVSVPVYTGGGDTVTTPSSAVACQKVAVMLAMLCAILAVLLM